MSYQCAAINTENQCTEWVQVGFLGLPDISTAQAGQISLAIAVVLVLAWGFKKLGSLLK